MNRITCLLGNVLDAFGVLSELTRYTSVFIRGLLTPKARLAARLLAAESQVAVYKLRLQQKKDPRPRFTPGFRLLWVALSSCWGGWKEHVHLMQPATVKKWHTQAFRYYWRHKSRRRLGRPPIGQQMRDLIHRLSYENPLWGAGQIRGTLVLLGYDPPCEDTIRKYMVRPKDPREKSTTWLPFLRNHLEVTWAMDFFTVVTLNFRFLYTFVVLDHGRRTVVHLATTYHPSMLWVIQQLREATPFGHQPRYMLRDNDEIYGNGVGEFLRGCGIEEVRTAYRSPWQNPYIERFVGTLRRELLDHVIVLSARHLTRLLDEYINEYYHVARPHQGLDGATPAPGEAPDPIDGQSKLVAFPVCGGLHHRYERVAA